MKNIFKCSKCNGKKTRTTYEGNWVMACTKCEIPVLLKEKKIGDYTYITLNSTSQRVIKKTVKVSPICFVDIDSEGYPIGVEILK